MKIKVKKNPHKEQYEFKCDICNKRFLDKWLLREHKKLHTTATPYSCKLCPYSGKTTKYLSRHMKLSHTAPTISCEICGKMFHFQCKLKDHMNVHTGAKPNKCKICGKAFNSSYSLSNHWLIHENRKPYQCTMCDYACRDSSTLRKHESRHLGEMRVFQCTLCDKVCKYKTDLRMHMDEKHFGVNVLRVPCEICGKMFKTKSLLTTHVRKVHARRTACKCEVCGAMCSTKGNLQTHLRTHLDIRPYTCTFERCGKRFKILTDLKKHNVIHYPERHYPCPTCGRLFVRQSRMKRHLMQHLPKVKSIRCDLCDILFYNENYIAAHMRNKHGGQLYQCDDCGFEAGNKPGLIRHINTQHGAPETCKICKKTFKRSNYLKLHYWRTHGIRYKTGVKKRRRGTSPDDRRRSRPTTKAVEGSHSRSSIECDVTVVKEEVESIPDTELLVVKKEIPDEEEQPLEIYTNYADDCHNGEDVEYSKRVLCEDLGRLLEKTCSEEAVKRPEQVFDDFMIENIMRTEEHGEENICTWETDKALEENAKRCVEKLSAKCKRKRKVRELEETRVMYNRRMREAMNKNTKTEHVIVKFVNNKNDDDASKQKEMASVEGTSDDDDKINELDEEASKDVVDQETDANDNEVKDDGGQRNRKIKINLHQCYVCFKLFETKPLLIEHCQEHFDVCTSVMLKKCPLCEYVTKLNLGKHMKLVHKINLKVPYAIKDKRHNDDGSRYYYDTKNSKVGRIELIPSVKNLNKREYVKMDARCREEKDKSIAKKKLVKKGGEWVVEEEKMAFREDYILPEFDSKEILKVKIAGEDYLDRMKMLSRLAKSRGVKMMFPCVDCEKICQTLSALKLHTRRHDPNPKPFKQKIWKHKTKSKQTVRSTEKPVNLQNRYASPKPIKNKHKCEPELKDFYKNNIKGGDIEFWQFLKIYNKMSRENIREFADLENRIDFGIHYSITPADQSRPKIPKRRLKPAFTRVVKLSKKEHLRRKKAKDELRKRTEC